MKYQIVINLTTIEENYSVKEINDLLKDKINGISLTTDLIDKVLCYTLLIFSNKEINLNFLGNIFFVTTSEEIRNVLKKVNLTIQSLEEIYKDDNYSIPILRGGLGNNLFQLITAYSYANENNLKIAINPNFCGIQHAKSDYLNSIFKKFQLTLISHGQVHEDPNENFMTYSIISKYTGNVFFYGYFQNEKYLENIVNYFYDYISIEKKPILEKSIFIHLRLGDYLTDKRYDAELFQNNYYLRAYEKFTHLDIKTIYILSNDVNLAKKLNNIQHIDIRYIDSHEFDSLMLMASCEYGGICPNSSFSWWGAYLNSKHNTSTKKIFTFPKIWFEGKTSDIYFMESIVI